MRTRAFSVVEAVIAIGIVIVLAALIYPILGALRASAYEAQCVSNLSQLQHSLQLYRQQSDGSGVYGTPAAMGLPPSLRQLLSIGKLSSEVVMCRGRGFDGLPPRYVQMWGFPGVAEDESNWARYVAEMEGNSIVLVDGNHRRLSEFRESQFFKHYAFGITLSGRIRRRTDYGSWTSLAWWR